MTADHASSGDAERFVKNPAAGDGAEQSVSLSLELNCRSLAQQILLSQELSNVQYAKSSLASQAQEGTFPLQTSFGAGRPAHVPSSLPSFQVLANSAEIERHVRKLPELEQQFCRAYRTWQQSQGDACPVITEAAGLEDVRLGVPKWLHLLFPSSVGTCGT